MRRRAELWAFLGVTLIAAIALIASQPRDAFWGSDSGNRFIQLQALEHTGSVAIPHRWPIGHHFITVAGKTYSIWAPTFSIASEPFYAAFGLAGLFVLPVAGTLMLIALMPMLTKGSITANATVLLLGTPLLWYTIVFWEHTLAAAIMVAAFVLAERDWPRLAGVLAGMSALFREEGYIAIVAIVIALLISRRPWRQATAFAAAALIPLVPFWMANAMMFGTPLGLHAAVYNSIAAGGKLTNFYPFLFEFSSVPYARFALISPAVVMLVASPFSLPSNVRIALFALTSAGFAGLAFLLLRSPAPIHETLYEQGLVPGVPFSAAIFLAVPQLWREQRFRMTAVVAAIVLTTLALNQSDFGVTWGPRYYFWLFPILIVLASDALGRFAASQIAVAAGVVLLLASFTIQFEGIRILRAKLRFTERVLQAVRSDPAPAVLTDVFWIPEDLGAAFEQKDFGLVRNDAELAAALRSVGRQPFLFIAARRFQLVSNRGYATFLNRVTRRARITGIDPMLDVMLLDVSAGVDARHSESSPAQQIPAFVRVDPPRRSATLERMGWTKKERRVLSPLRTPAHIQRFLDELPYDEKGGAVSPRVVMRRGKAQCYSGVLFACAALRELGYAPRLMWIDAVSDDGHCLALYDRGGLWGSVAKSNYTTLRSREPVYPYLPLGLSYFEGYFNQWGKRTMRAFTVPVELEPFESRRWRFSEGSLPYIDRAIDTAPRAWMLPRGLAQQLTPVSEQLRKAGLLGANPRGLWHRQGT